MNFTCKGSASKPKSQLLFSLCDFLDKVSTKNPLFPQAFTSLLYLVIPDFLPIILRISKGEGEKKRITKPDLPP